MNEQELQEKSSTLIRLHQELLVTSLTESLVIVSSVLIAAIASLSKSAGPDYEQSHTPTALVTLQEF